VFPIWGKIKKPRFRLAEHRETRENLFFFGFEMNAILRDKLNTIVKLLLLFPAQFINKLLIKLSIVFQCLQYRRMTIKANFNLSVCF